MKEEACFEDQAGCFNMARFANRMIFSPREKQIGNGERQGQETSEEVAGVATPHPNPTP